jgi:hypothetical protein
MLFWQQDGRQEREREREGVRNFGGKCDLYEMCAKNIYSSHMHGFHTKCESVYNNTSLFQYMPYYTK